MYSKLHTSKNGKVSVRISTTERQGYMPLGSEAAKAVRESLRRADQALRIRRTHGEKVSPFYLNKLDNEGFVVVGQASSNFIPIAESSGQWVEL